MAGLRFIGVMLFAFYVAGYGPIWALTEKLHNTSEYNPFVWYCRASYRQLVEFSENDPPLNFFLTAYENRCEDLIDRIQATGLFGEPDALGNRR